MKPSKNLRKLNLRMLEEVGNETQSIRKPLGFAQSKKRIKAYKTTLINLIHPIKSSIKTYKTI